MRNHESPDPARVNESSSRGSPHSTTSADVVVGPASAERLELGRSIASKGMEVDLPQLRYFLSAAAHLNFGRAARAMAVRRPTLSRQIRQLEDNLGVSLFERHCYGVTLTGAGRNFSVRANRILFELDHARSEAARAGQAECGRLSIGTFISLTSGLLREFIEAHHRSVPELQLQLREGSHADLIAALHEHHIDVAIGNESLVGAGVATLPLWRERVYVALPTGHVRASGTSPICWHDLRAETILLRSWESAPSVYEYVSRHLPLGTPIVQHLASRELVLGLVGAGFGITIVSEAATGAAYPGIAFRRIDEPDAIVTITAAWLGSADNPAQKKFLASLRDYAKRDSACKAPAR
jgi:DNA-binding transcriptional LysR family regulator